MSRLLVVVPASRKLCGRLALLSSRGEVLSGPFRVLAMASRAVGRKHGNPRCLRERPFGDPPAGAYALTGSLPPNTMHRRPRRFGRLGGLLLEPTAGEALAAVANGRYLYTLHGGKTDRAGRLFPTRGGLRMHDAKLRVLLRAVNTAHERGDPVAGLDLIEVADASIVPRRKLRPARRKRRSTKPAASTSLGLLPLLGGFAIASSEQKMNRRRFLAAALLLAGGLGQSACDKPSPAPCYPIQDPKCAPIVGGGSGGGGGGSEPDYPEGGGSG